jgi:hypothetical protein
VMQRTWATDLCRVWNMASGKNSVSAALAG